MNWSSRWSPLQILIFILLKCGTTRPMLASEERSTPRLIVAASHTALSGDLGVLIIELPAARGTPPSSVTEDAPDLDDSVEEDYSIEKIPLQEPFVLRVLRLDGFTSERVGEVPVQVPNVSGVNVSLVVPCGLFSRGGSYALELEHRREAGRQDQQQQQPEVRASLDVRWPTPSLALEPQHLDTYPSQPVLASLEYGGVTCSALPGVPVPTYSLQLLYCGSSVLSCDPRNRSQHLQALYSEEVSGFPAQRLISLRCEYFGLAGHYALRLRPSAANPSAPTTSAYMKVELSELFVFNVHARSVYPCEGGGGSGNSGGGVSVLFEYPACRLPGDRVRLYGRLRADVASLAPPSSLHYVAELKAPPGKHSLTFDCDLFTERFVEYCFVYISQAYNGAMSEVRVDCIPTFPLQEGDAGGWGPWSQWTPCSSSCVGGTRSRHRFCDTPPPRYGAKFCQGQTVESEACGGSQQLDLRGSWSPGDWECRHGEGLAADRAEVAAEVGAKCRCGCSLELEQRDQSVERILAASSRTCPGRSFWLVQADEPGMVVRLRFDQARFPCAGQYARLRDGDSLVDELLADVNAERRDFGQPILSSGPRMLLEFFSGEADANADPEACLAGFLAHVAVLPKPEENATKSASVLMAGPKVMAAAGRWLTPAHLVAASLLCLTFLVSVFLALQYACKYRKYQLAEDLDSLTDNSTCSGSMQGIARRARAVSSSTLISEVVSLVKLPRRPPGSPKHAKLDETEAGYESTETQPDVEEEEEEEDRRTIVPTNSVRSTPTRRSSASSASTTTLAANGAPQAEVKYARPVKLRTFGPVSPVSEEAASTSEDGRRFSVTSASTSQNNGFSPASSSSNSTLRRCSGKESKERRNRERLLQGPGSELSLANPELDLELDYYDYNVVNAGAAPGSYLGMDPAFLVWIPPLGEEPQYEEIEGAALTPAEYQRQLRLSRQQLHQEDSSENEAAAGEESRGCRLHDEIIMEYKARLSEGMLPIHRILDESRVRVSEESLSSGSDVIPNRLETTRRLPKRTRIRSKDCSSESSTQSLEEPLAAVNDLDTPRTRRRLRHQELDRDYCEVNISAATLAPPTPNLPRRHHRDEDIPLAEFSRNRQESPVKVHSSRTKTLLQSPDYGVDVRETKESFYDLIAEDGIKFADDDDEYIDNKVVA